MDATAVVELARQLLAVIIQNQLRDWELPEVVQNFVNNIIVSCDILNNPRNVVGYITSELYQQIADFIHQELGATPQQPRSLGGHAIPDIQPRARRRLDPGASTSRDTGTSQAIRSSQDDTVNTRSGRMDNIRALHEARRNPDAHDEEIFAEQEADIVNAQQGADNNIDQGVQQDPDLDPIRAPNGPGVTGANPSKDYPMMQRAVRKGCTTTCTYERVYEHVVPSTPPSRKKFEANVQKDFITDASSGRTASDQTFNKFINGMTPHHTCWITSDGWFVLPQLCPAMVQNDHYVHMLGACSRSRILAAYDTIIVKELLTYHTTNHATDTQQILSTKQPSLIMVQTDENNLPAMPQWLVPTDTDQHDFTRYDWMAIEVGCGKDQQYPNEKFKKSSADDRKTEILPKYEAIFSTTIARRKERGLNASGNPVNTDITENWCEVTLNQMLGCDPSNNEDWIDTAKLIKHSLRPGQGFQNNYHISQTTDWNKLIDIATQRDTITFCPPETDPDLRNECIPTISSNDRNVAGTRTNYLHCGEDCPEYDHLWIQHNPQLFWWTPVSGYTPTSQFQEGHPIASLQLKEYQWVTQPVTTTLTGIATQQKGLQLRSFKSQATDFTYNPTIMFGLTTTTYADSSWIKMDAILDVKRTLVVQFSFDDSANFNINPYIDLRLKSNTIKHYFNYKSKIAFKTFRPGPRMSKKHKKKHGNFY